MFLHLSLRSTLLLFVKHWLNSGSVLIYFHRPIPCLFTPSRRAFSSSAFLMRERKKEETLVGERPWRAADLREREMKGHFVLGTYQVSNALSTLP